MTPTQIRLRIVELRSRLVSARLMSPGDERKVLEQIEELRGKLTETDASRPRSKMRQELEELARATGVQADRRDNPPVHVGRVPQDRRRHPRFPVSIAIRFTIATLPSPEMLVGLRGRRHAAPAKTRDISRSGILYTTNVPVPIGSQIEVELPLAATAAKEARRVAAQIVRRDPVGEGSYLVAARFSNPRELPPDWITNLRLTGTER